MNLVALLVLILINIVVWGLLWFRWKRPCMCLKSVEASPTERTQKRKRIESLTQEQIDWAKIDFFRELSAPGYLEAKRRRNGGPR